MNLFLENIKQVNTVIDYLFLSQLSVKQGVYPEHFKYVNNQDVVSKKWEYYCLSGSGVHIPYTKFYKDELKKIDSIISFILSSGAYPNERMGVFLKKIKQTISDNDWSSLEEFWLKNRCFEQEYVWNFGPIEAQSDKFFQTKRFFTSVLVQRNLTQDYLVEELQKSIKDFSLSLESKGSVASDSVHFVIGDVITWGGETKNIFAVGWSRPEKPEFLERYGSVKQVYLNILKEKIEQFYIPMLPLIFDRPDVIQELTAFFRERYFMNVILHEFCHTIGKFPGYRERMSGNYVTFEESRADFTSYLFASFLESANKLEKDYLKKMILANLVVLLHMLYDYMNTGRRYAYASLCHLLCNTLGLTASSKDEMLSIGFEDVKTIEVLDKANRLLKAAKDYTWSEAQDMFKKNEFAEKCVSKLKYHSIPLTIEQSNIRRVPDHT